MFHINILSNMGNLVTSSLVKGFTQRAISGKWKNMSKIPLQCLKVIEASGISSLDNCLCKVSSNEKTATNVVVIRLKECTSSSSISGALYDAFIFYNDDRIWKLGYSDCSIDATKVIEYLI